MPDCMSCPCRVMVPCQQIWVTELSTATGRSHFGSSRQPLLVQVPEEQVGWQLGDVVHIIGHAGLHTAADAAGGCCSVQVSGSWRHLVHALQPETVQSQLHRADAQRPSCRNKSRTQASGQRTPGLLCRFCVVY